MGARERITCTEALTARLQSPESFEVHNKTNAIHAAERAVRPKSAITGLGERAGSVSVQQHGRHPKSAASHEKQRNHSQQQLTRPHTASAAAPSRGPRDIWPQDMQQKPARFCVGCRGDHDPQHEHNPDWQPYTPLQRFANLNMLESRFQVAVRNRELPIGLTGASQPIKWLGVTPEGKAMKPHNLSELQYKQLLPLLFEGAREGHEPYRFMASYAALDLLAVAADNPLLTHSSKSKGHTANLIVAAHTPQALWLLQVLPEVVAAVKAGLNTMQPALAAHMMLMLQRLLRANNNVGPAMVPFYKQLLPVMALLLRHGNSHRGNAGMSKRLLLPPVGCLPPVGDFTGDGKPPTGSPTCCQVCGAAFGRSISQKLQQQQQLHQQLNPQEGICGRPLSPPCSAPMFGGETPCVHARTVGIAIKPIRATVAAVVEETLQLMAEVGQGPGMAAIKSYLPQFDYCNPQD